jgi:hypothetical protein
MHAKDPPGDCANTDSLYLAIRLGFWSVTDELSHLLGTGKPCPRPDVARWSGHVAAMQAHPSDKDPPAGSCSERRFPEALFVMTPDDLAHPLSGEAEHTSDGGEREA